MTGDTINLASRLCRLATAGTILAGPETYRLTQAYFTFKRCRAVEVKGKSGPIQPFEVLVPKVKPTPMRRLHGLQAKLVGRTSEMALLPRRSQSWNRDSVRLSLLEAIPAPEKQGW